VSRRSRARSTGCLH